MTFIDVSDRHDQDVLDSPHYRFGRRAYWNDMHLDEAKMNGTTAHERCLIEQGWLDARDNEDLLN